MIFYINIEFFRPRLGAATGDPDLSGFSWPLDWPLAGLLVKKVKKRQPRKQTKSLVQVRTLSEQNKKTSFYIVF